MLYPPYSRYRRLYTYHFDRTGMPAVDDPDLIGIWEEGDTTIYFFHQPKTALMEAIGRRNEAALIYVADVDYRDWEAGRELTPFWAGGLRIAPIWDSGDADIRIDPSVVFGSGFHPSTRLCLEAMADLLARQSPTDMVDLGTGTGLLAIAAARLGVPAVTAVDHNQLACRVCEKNAATNLPAGRLTVRRLDLFQEYPETKEELLVANLHLELLLHLFSNPSFLGHRWYIIGGFRAAQEEKLLAALPGKHLVFIDRRRQDDWCLWLLRRRPSPPERPATQGDHRKNQRRETMP